MGLKKLLSIMLVSFLILLFSGCGSNNPGGTNQAKTNTPSAPLPSASISATAGNTQNTITWTPVTGAISYNLYYSTASNPVTIANGIKIPNITYPYNHLGLTNGTTYYYSIEPVILNGTAPNSATVSATPLAMLLNPPTNLVANTSLLTVPAGKVQLSWNAASGAVGYKIYASSTTPVVVSPANLVSASAGTSILLTMNWGLTNYVVTAYNAAGQESGPSNEVTAILTINNKHLMGGAIQGVPLNLAGTVTTIAGASGASGSVNGTGMTARFNRPNGITIDTFGTFTLYITDFWNNSVRKVDYNNTVTTIASSTITQPTAITTDGHNIYLIDRINSCIRKIDSFGNMTILAGTPGVFGFVDGPGASAQFRQMEGITTDNSYIYIGDRYDPLTVLNNPRGCIRKISIFDGSVTTLPTIYNSLISGNMTTDGTYLYVEVDHTIQKTSIVTGVTTTLAGVFYTMGFQDGIGAGALFNYPAGITTDGTSLYVTDNYSIRKIDKNTGAVTTITTLPFTGGGAGITTDGTSLFVCDWFGNTICKIQ